MTLDSLPDISAADGTDAQLLHGNGGKRGWVVQKFGGTSVGKFADKIAEDVVR